MYTIKFDKHTRSMSPHPVNWSVSV